MAKNTNLLPNETSPYLLQHKDNPVHWWPWCADALTAAKDENKPILLSIGYAACHWCHVMAHESFEDKKIASLMNELFINIKVDREERPDIDAIYQKALQTMGEAGGWPLTMILTPEGKPFFGGTYFPKTPSHGRPDFTTVLEKISDVYKNKPGLVNGNADKIVEHLKKINTPTISDEPVSTPTITEVADKIIGIMDDVHGGTQGAPKFPQTTMLILLWWAYQKTGDDTYKNAVFLAVKKMSLGGIYDHIGGGYSRYSTDQFWFAPHFEKMLYDNAYILEMLVLLYQSSGDVFWRRRASETISWLTRELQINHGAFASAIDADSEGREGAFYVWQTDEIKEILGDKAELFLKTFGVNKTGNWREGLPGENIIHQLHLEKPLSDAEEGRLKDLKKTLLEKREERTRPLTDHKILCDWNGMIITALVGAARAFNEPKWLELAKHTFQYITTNLGDDSGHLVHSFCDEKSGASGLLDDYAHMTRAAVKLYEETGDYAYLNQAEIWADMVLKNFKNPHGAYYQSASDNNELIIKTCDAQDGATPSGNAVFLECLARLYHLTYKPNYQSSAENLYAAFARDVTENPFSYVALIQAKTLLDQGVLITIIGDRKDKKVHEFLEAINTHESLKKILQPIGSFSDLPKNHPAQIKSTIAGACVIICENGHCGLPIKTMGELVEQLQNI